MNFEYEMECRHKIWCDLSIIITYYDLINANIIHIVPSQKFICPDCFQRYLLGINNPVNLTDLKEQYSKLMKLQTDEYDQQTGEITFRIENLDDIFPYHTELVTCSDEKSQMLSDDEKQTGATVHNDTFKLSFISEIIDDEYEKICLYSLYSRICTSKFITAKNSDSILLNMTQIQEQNSSKISQLNNIPFYDLPIITNVPISTILHLREVEGIAFNKYRIALNRAIQEQYKAKETIQVREIYDDIVYPAFQKLDMKLHNIKTDIYKKTFASVVVISSVITAGIYTGLIPNNANDILTAIGGAIGGTSVITTAGIRVLDSLMNRNEPLRENDFYFLWKLKQKTDKTIHR